MMTYCGNCGKTLTRMVPEGDDRLRDVCLSCGAIHYENPKMVLGCIPEWKDKVLLCKRAIEPGHGKWTLPAGFMENGETVEQGVCRETFEEARARVRDLEPYALYNLAFIGQVYMLFRARLMDLDFEPGEESLAVALFDEDEIPWDKLAFRVVEKTLKRYFRDRKKGAFPFFIGNIEPSRPERRG